MKLTIEGIPSQSSPGGVWLGGELYVAHVDLDADDLGQLSTSPPYLEIVPPAGVNRAYQVLQMSAEWYPGRVFDSDLSLYVLYGLELGDLVSSVGAIAQPMKIPAGIELPILVPAPYTIPLTNTGLLAPVESIENMPLGLLSSAPFTPPGALAEYSIANGEAQGTGYTAGDEVTMGDGGAVIHVDSVDGDGAVLVSHLVSGGDPLYVLGGTYSDAHSGEEGHGTGLTLNPTAVDGDPATGDLHLELYYRKTQLHAPQEIQ